MSKQNLLNISSSPHIRSVHTVPQVMRDVVIALVPALFMAVYYFGFRALAITIIAVISAVVTERFIAVNLLKREVYGKRWYDFYISDWSAVITGILLAYNLPVGVPLWVPVVGSVFSVGVAKWVFGGLGQNVVNPALAGRAFLLANYTALMTGSIFKAVGKSGSNGWWRVPESLSGITNSEAINVEAIEKLTEVGLKSVPTNENLVDLVTSATPLNLSKELTRISTTIKEELVIVSDSLIALDSTVADSVNSLFEPLSGFANTLVDISYALKNLFLGNIGGTIGETSAAALLIGAVYMLYKGVINFTIPLTYIGFTFLFFWVFNGVSTNMLSTDALTIPTFHILSGGLMLGAFFMATDMVTSPITQKGQFIFAFGAALLTFLIRKFGGYPEGVSYSILLMNIVTPLIDRYIRPRIYGAKK